MKGYRWEESTLQGGTLVFTYPNREWEVIFDPKQKQGKLLNQKTNKKIAFETGNWNPLLYANEIPVYVLQKINSLVGVTIK